MRQLAEEVLEVTGKQERDRLSSAARGRPQVAPAGHPPGAADSGLVAGGFSRREGLSMVLPYFRKAVRELDPVRAEGHSLTAQRAAGASCEGDNMAQSSRSMFNLDDVAPLQAVL